MPKKIPHPLSFGNNPSALVHVFPRYIWDDPTLSLYEASVLCRVATFENSNPPLDCYLSFEQWATELRCTRRHAINVLNGLIEKNRLRKESRGLQTNIWRLVNTVHYQEGTSEHSSLPLVNTVHYPSEYSSLVLVNTVHPRRSLEDQKEDHKEDHIPESLLSQDDPGTPLKKNEVQNPDSVFKSSLTTEEPFLEKLEPQVGEAPPIPVPPPEARRFIAAELPQEHRAKLLAQLTGPATRAGRDPEQVLVDILNRAEAWSNKGTDKKKFRVTWYETLKRQWVAREIKNLSERAQRHPVSQTGLSRDQIDTLWDLGWKSYHKEDWPEPIPDPDWVTDWHRDLFSTACSEAFGVNYRSFFEEEPAKNSNFHALKFRRAVERIKLPEIR